MLRIAVQAKGRLYEETMLMLSESSIKIESGKRTLLIPAKNFPIEVLFLRDDDIPQAVASGIADVGVVGENEYAEKQEDAEIVKRFPKPFFCQRLGIKHTRFHLRGGVVAGIHLEDLCGRVVDKKIISPVLATLNRLAPITIPTRWKPPVHVDGSQSWLVGIVKSADE